MYKASIENRGDSRSYAATRHASFVLDTQGNGANPVDTLLASLCGCMGHYVRDFLTGQRIAHPVFAITAEAGVTPDKARLTEIRVCVDLGEVKLNDRQATDMLTFIRNCKVHNILNDGPGVTISLAGHRGNRCC